MTLNKLHKKGFSIAVKTGGANNDHLKFAREASKGEMFYNTFDDKLYIATSDAGAADAILYNTDAFSLTPPPYGNAYSITMDGANDHLSLANSVTTSGEFTISMWVKPLSGNEGMMFKGTGTEYINWYGPLYGNKLLVRNMGGITTGTDTMLANNWYHVLYSRNSSNLATLYLNGSSVGSATFTNNFTFNKIWESNANGLHGRVDEVAFWTDDQSANIADIRDTTLGTPKNLGDMTTQPTHWWRMGDYPGDYNSGSGTSITDQGIGTSNTASFQNGPNFSLDIPS